MSKKGLKFGIASAAVIGAGAAVLQAKNKSEAKKAAETTTVTSEPKNDYRNTERGKDKKNSKGIYYTNGNYEAFARPEKPEGVDEKSAYLVGSGLAALAAACFLVRDGQMKGDHIHILEAMDIAGGACDGQVLVIHDMLGINKGFSPRFLRRYADLHELMTGAVQQYIKDVKECDFPSEKEQY